MQGDVGVSAWLDIIARNLEGLGGLVTKHSQPAIWSRPEGNWSEAQ